MRLETAVVPTGLGELYVQVVGSGPPALLWHSLFVDARSWDGMRAPLSEHRQLVIVNGPGHGGSGGPYSAFSLDDCATAAIEILAAVGFPDDAVDWVGNAWGGHVGVAFAAGMPQRCRSLVAIGTPIKALPRREARQVRLLRAVYRLTGPIDPLVRPLCDGLLGRSGDPDHKQLVAQAFRGAERTAMASAIQSVSLHGPDLNERLPAVIAPTLFVAGANDPTWTPDEACAAAALVRHGRSDSVPGGGHVAPLYEAPDALASLVQCFWGEVEGVGEPGAPGSR